MSGGEKQENREKEKLCEDFFPLRKRYKKIPTIFVQEKMSKIYYQRRFQGIFNEKYFEMHFSDLEEKKE